MNNFHEQAMGFVYHQVLHRLQGFFSRPERIALQLLIQRLLVAAGGVERIGHYRVMVVHEGGKECAYTLAFLRAAQLSIAGRSTETFKLRIAILRQPRMTANVMTRIQTQCNELFICQHRLKTDPPYRSKTDPPRRYLKSVYGLGKAVSRGTTWPDFSLSFSR